MKQWLTRTILLISLAASCGCSKQHFLYKKTSELPLTVVIPSYNNKNWLAKNLDSVRTQQYHHFNILYIDDCSTDGTSAAVDAYQKKYNLKNLTIIHNKSRRGALYNHYSAIALCDNNSIIVSLDGDDWFAHDKVLQRINHEYQTKNIWLTYGQFMNWPSPKRGWCKTIPEKIIAENKFREFGFCSAQPRTYYAWLAKKIKKEDLLDVDGNFYHVAGDVALMFPMLEMCGTRFSFIDEILYIRNIETPLNDFKIHQKEQERITLTIRAKQKYSPLPKKICTLSTSCATIDVKTFLGESYDTTHQQTSNNEPIGQNRIIAR